MEFSEFQHLTHQIGTIILVLLYALRLIVLFGRRPAQDIASTPKGEIWRGTADALITIVAPWKMESTRRHWTRYAEFIFFHLGIFLNIALSFAVTYVPYLLSGAVRSAVFICLMAAVIAGCLRLYRRVASPEMRIISSPDDYIAMVMVLLFLFTGLLTLRGWEPGIIAYFIIAALFLVYEPFSKIRHYIYFPFARCFHGAAFGRRGVIGRKEGVTRG